MIKVGDTTMKLLKAKPGSHFLFEYNSDIPIRTCKKYGVDLRVIRNKALGLKFVTRL
jgi:hypothetical protein